MVCHFHAIVCFTKHYLDNAAWMHFVIDSLLNEGQTLTEEWCYHLHIYVLRRRERNPVCIVHMLYCSLKTAKRKKKKTTTTTVWRVSRVAAINIDVRADVTRTGQRYGEGIGVRGLNQVDPAVTLWSFTKGRFVCSLLLFICVFVYREGERGDFLLWQNAQARIGKKTSRQRSSITGTFPRKEAQESGRGGGYYWTHTATSNQSVFYISASFKRSENFTPSWTL